MKKIGLSLLLLTLLAGCFGRDEKEYIPDTRKIPAELVDCKEHRPKMPAKANDASVGVLLLRFDAALDHCVNDAETIKTLFAVDQAAAG